MIELAAFLGNPGKEYSGNRHNAGFLLAEKLPFYGNLSWQKKHRGFYASVDGDYLKEYVPGITPDEDAPSRVHFILPQTFMNLSGEPVYRAASFYKVKTENILVAHDELELPLGTLSLKSGGGLGGHNGLRSMKACFGAVDFWRLRIGIGRPDKRLPGEGGPPGSGEGIVDWVLSDFSAEEKDTMDTVLETAAALLLKLFIIDPNSLLGEWGKKKISPVR